MRNTLTLLCLLVANTILYAQDCNNILIGEVIDYHDNTPLSNATIQIQGKEKHYLSDAMGKFTIKNLCNGTIELEVSHPECSTRFIRIEISGNTYKQIVLEHHLEELDEVKVTSSTINKTNSAQENILKTDQLERFSGNTLGDALKQINGVSSLSTGSNIVKPVIQGLGGSRILILNNGIRMQDMEWGDEHAPNIDLNSAENVTVVKGAAALQFGGDAIGGIILLDQNRIPKKDSIYGKTLLHGISNGQGGNISTALTRTYKNGAYIKGQASYKKLGDAETSQYILSNTGVSQLGASIDFGKLNFEEGWNAYYTYFNTTIGILRASHIGNVDDLITAINNNEPTIVNNFTYTINDPHQEVSHHLGKLNYYKRFQGVGKLNVQYDLQQNHRYEYDIRVGDDKDKPALDLKLTTQTVAVDFKADSYDKKKITFGILGRHQENYANPETGVRRLIPDYKKADFGAFTTMEYQLSDNSSIDAGLRYDYSKIDAKKYYRTSRWEERGYDTDFSEIIIDDLGTQLLTNPILEYHNFSGSAGLHYIFKNNDQFRFNYTLAQRTPNPAELFSDGLHHSAARVELGDLRIKSETSHRFAASISKDDLSWGYELSPYINFISDFILLEPTGIEFSIRGAFPVWEYRQTDARLIGIDASMYALWSSNWRTDHQFSLTKGKETNNDMPLINMPSARFQNGITYTKKEWNNFHIELQSEYVFKQNEYVPNIDVYSPQQDQEVELKINTPPNAYHLLKLDSEMKFNFDNKALTVGLGITNFLNTTYREYLNRQRLFTDDLGRSITLKLKFNY
ncbi:TonB-dependent receptor [Cellulophaga sp. F20128]|uniref:TonB-dependent receptor n=1 Tax=Cellulophaga sp. F20128 TaxID=2926413 RepID=UPI001FF3E02A|nr:TonB-dependent receptor [Cellulophaga sp. F20128]MCK0156069.1 TonB-dependent receptor [Cellulophaga sp. F20128]